MPINYSKFDQIVDSDDEDDQLAHPGGGGGEDFARLMERLCAGGESGSDTGSASGGRDFWDLNSAALDSLTLGRQAPPPPDDDFDLGSYGAGFGSDFDGLGDGLGSQRSLDFAALRGDAWHLLLGRLVSQPNAAGAVRSLLLEAELLLMASRYQEALVMALALQLATAPDCDGPSNGSGAGVGRLVGGARAGVGAGGHHGLEGEWTSSALVVEMVSCYQLGDRDRALELRDRLQKMDHSSLSEHLKKRFSGTSEVLDLVPQFMSLLKAAEEERKAKGAGA